MQGLELDDLDQQTLSATGGCLYPETADCGEHRYCGRNAVGRTYTSRLQNIEIIILQATEEA